MLKTVQIVLTREDDRSKNNHNNKNSNNNNNNNIRVAHFLNGYIKREREKKKKKNRKRKREDEKNLPSSSSSSTTSFMIYNLLYIPRILKNDLRRQYPIIFANVYNTCDSNLMLKFFHQFCDIHTGLVTLRDTYSFNGLPHTLTADIHGADNYGRLWSFRMTETPDLYFQLHSIQIRVRSDGTCICQAKYFFSGTSILFVNPNRIPKILKSCVKTGDTNGMYSLPKVFNFGEIFIDQIPFESQEKMMMKMKESNSNDESNQEYEFNEFSEMDQQLFHECVNDGGGDDDDDDDDNNNADQSADSDMTSSFNEEKEYLSSIFTEMMNPTRASPRIPDLSETLALQIPFQYIGDATFHVNDQSKIFRLDLQSSLVPK